MSNTTEYRPPLPPFTRETAIEKIRKAEDAWNTRDPAKVALAYTMDSRWRNRSEFLQGRQAIIEFLTRKWQSELEYRLIKELWAFDSDRIAVRFAYEWHDAQGAWFPKSALTPARHAQNNVFKLVIVSDEAAETGAISVAIASAEHGPPYLAGVRQRELGLRRKRPNA